jgi:hypothetical protein
MAAKVYICLEAYPYLIRVPRSMPDFILDFFANDGVTQLSTKARVGSFWRACVTVGRRM